LKYDFETSVNRGPDGSAKWYFMHRENEALPQDIIPFSVADMELKNPPEIMEGLREFLNDELILGYTIPTPRYFFAVTDWMKRRHNWQVSPDWLVMSPGVVPALYASVKCFAKPGEGVIIFSPVYYPFKKSIEASNRKVVDIPLILNEMRYEIDWEAFEKEAKDPNNKLLMFCSPHNPVGRVWTREELYRVSETCLKNNLLMLCDEIHHDLIMPGFKHTVYATLSKEAEQNCLVCTAPSKSFNLAGLQTSNIIIPNPEIREVFQREMERASLRTLNTVGFKACELAYNECEDWLEELICHIDKNRKFAENFISNKLPQIKVFPMEGTYLQWWDCRGLGLDYEKLRRFLREKAYLITDEGHIFGETGKGFIRMNLACPTQVLEAALERLHKAVLNGLGV